VRKIYKKKKKWKIGAKYNLLFKMKAYEFQSNIDNINLSGRWVTTATATTPHVHENAATTRVLAPRTTVVHTTPLITPSAITIMTTTTTTAPAAAALQVLLLVALSEWFCSLRLSFTARGRELENSNWPNKPPWETPAETRPSC
jgi:hypothetical protein